jgi:two-component system, NtrC family, sensor kinase
VRLTVRLVGWIVLGILALLVGDAFLFVRREREVLREDMKAQARQLGRSLATPVADAWGAGGEAAADRLVGESNRPDNAVRIRLVRLDGGAAPPPSPELPAAQIPPLAGATDVSVEAEDAEGERHLYTYVPLSLGGGAQAALELREDFTREERLLRATRDRVLWVAGAFLVVGALGVWVSGVHLLGRPLQRLIEKTRRMRDGDLSQPVRLLGRHELSDLARGLNEACERLSEAERTVRGESERRVAAVEELRHADRLKTVGQLAAGVAHELGTPLNVVSGRARLIGSGRLPVEEERRSAQVIEEQTARMTSIIRGLLDFARRGAAHRKRTDLQALVQRTVGFLSTLGHPGRLLLLPPPGGGPIEADVDPSQIEQVLTNLCLNALEAMPRGGTAEVEIRKVRAVPPPPSGRGEGAFVRLAVRDEGVGIPEEDLPQVFDPFFTTKEVGQGTGLGLSIAHGIVQDHGGWIEVRSEVGKGTRFEVFLPEAAP